MIALIVLSIMSGILYRRGGSDKTWHGKERDWGCALCFLIAYSILSTIGLKTGYIAYILTLLLSWGALSIYWKKGTDCRWYHWALHGLGCGLAALPLMLTGVPLVNIAIRTLFVVITYTAVSEFSEDVVYEEFMRGFIFTASAVFLI